MSPAFLACFYDACLEATHVASAPLLVDLVPVFVFAGGCTKNVPTGRSAADRFCPRHLRLLLLRFTKLSHNRRPRESLPAFAVGTGLIRSITERLSLPPRSHTRRPVGSPYGSLSSPGAKKTTNLPRST